MNLRHLPKKLRLSFMVTLVLFQLGLISVPGFLLTGRAYASTTINKKFAFSINLQQNGSVLTGSHTFTFAIYDALTGGSQLWSEGPTTMTSTTGAFTGVLGSTVPIPDTVFVDGSQRYLSVTLDTTNTLSPRLELASAPYSFVSKAVPQVAADPGVGTAAKGELVFNTTSNILKVFDGTAWVTVSGGTSTTATTLSSTSTTTLSTDPGSSFNAGNTTGSTTIVGSTTNLGSTNNATNNFGTGTTSTNIFGSTTSTNTIQGNTTFTQISNFTAGATTTIFNSTSTTTLASGAGSSMTAGNSTGTTTISGMTTNISNTSGATNNFATGAASTNIFGSTTSTNTIQGATTFTQPTTFNSTATFSALPSLPLTSGSILVGNGSNTAAAVVLSGDASLSNSGALTVDKIKNTNVVFTGLASGDLLQYNGTSIVNVTPASLGSISLAAGSSGTDVNVSGSPASLGGTLTINIPDASGTARGLVTTGTQTISGNKTFTGNTSVGGTFGVTGLASFTGAASLNGGGTVTNSAGLLFNPYGIAAGNTTEARFVELAANGTNYVGFKSPDSIAASLVWALPAVDGSSGQVLKTDGAGNLSWVTTSGGSSAFSSLTAATASNTVDNLNFAQTWNWSTAASTVPLTMNMDNINSANGFALNSAASSLSGALLKVEATSNTAGVDGEMLRVEYSGGSSGSPTVVNIINAGDGPSFRVNDNGTSSDSSPFLINKNGEVGIGDTSPAVKLAVKDQSTTDGNTIVYIQGPTLPAAFVNLAVGAADDRVGLLLHNNTSSGDEYMWFDDTGIFRHSDVLPTTHDDGGAVGAQSSSLKTKNLQGEFAGDALATILDTKVYDFTYKDGRYDNEKFTGIVTDYSPVFGMDKGRSLNTINAVGYLVSGLKDLHKLTFDTSISAADLGELLARQESLSLVSKVNVLVQEADRQAKRLLSLEELVRSQQVLGGSVSMTSFDNLAKNGLITVESDMDFHGHIYASSDTVGTAVVKAGTTTYEVIFSKPYRTAPVVTISVAQDGDFAWDTIAYRVVNTTTQGFTVEIKPGQAIDIAINWHAFASTQIRSDQVKSEAPTEALPTDHSISAVETAVDAATESSVSETSPDIIAPIEPSIEPVIETTHLD